MTLDKFQLQQLNHIAKLRVILDGIEDENFWQHLNKEGMVSAALTTEIEWFENQIKHHCKKHNLNITLPPKLFR